MSENSNSKRPFELEWEWTELLKQRLPLKCRSTPHLHEISPNTYNSYFSISSWWNKWPETDDVFSDILPAVSALANFENIGSLTKQCTSSEAGISRRQRYLALTHLLQDGEKMFFAYGGYLRAKGWQASTEEAYFIKDLCLSIEYSCCLLA